MEGTQIKFKPVTVLEYVSKISFLIVGFIILVYRNNALQDFFEYLFLSFFKDDEKITYSKICTFFSDSQEGFIYLFWKLLILLVVLKLSIKALDKNNKQSFKNIFESYGFYNSFKKHLINFFKSLKISLINFYKKLIKSDESNKSDKLTKLYQNLATYIEDSHDKAFVINGEWGSGKTHSLKNFIDEYFKYDKQKPIYIPCFGINTREQVEKLIKSSYENNDESLKSKFNSLIKSVPIFGEGLQDLFKPKYDFKSMKKGSVFIFDDFERICECYQDEKLLNLIKNFNLKLEKNKNSNNNEQEEANLEFNLDNFAGAFLKLNLYNFNSTNLDKFNTVSGVISELIDNYNMRVIIICNRNLLDTRMFNEIFHNKISSIVYEFKLEPNEDKIENLINNTLKEVIIDEEKSNLIKEFLNNEKMNIISLWNYCNFNNLRFLSNILLSFIYVINQFDLKLINKNDLILGDIFYSIFIKHINNYCFISKLPYCSLKNFTQYEILIKVFDAALGLKDLSIENKTSLRENLEFLQNYIYIGDDISNYWYSGLNLNLRNIEDNLEYFSNIKKDHLLLKFCKFQDNLKDFNITEILTSVKYFRFEDFTECIRQNRRIELSENDLNIIISNIISEKCIINNNATLDINSLFKKLNTLIITSKIIPILLNDFDLLISFFNYLCTKCKYSTTLTPRLDFKDLNLNFGKNTYTDIINDDYAYDTINISNLFEIFLYCKETPNLQYNFKEIFEIINNKDIEIFTYDF